MKKCLFILVMLTISKLGIGQNLDSCLYKAGTTSLGKIIYDSFKKSKLLKRSKSLCIESCTFIKFTIFNKKVVDVKFSKLTPKVITTSVTKALYQTNGHWLDIDTTVYLLPLVYVFENRCHAKNRTTESVSQILTDLSDNPDRITFTGAENDPPLKCTILNPLLLKYIDGWIE